MKDTTGLKPPWEKGQSGNPKGKPKGIKNKTTIFNEWLDKYGGKVDGKRKSNFELLVFKYIKIAKEATNEKDAMRAIEKIFDLSVELPKKTLEVEDITPNGEKIDDRISRLIKEIGAGVTPKTKEATQEAEGSNNS